MLIDHVVWPQAVEKGEVAFKMLKEELGFDDVTIYTDKSKKEIDEVLANLHDRAKTFEQNSKGKEV